MISLGRKQILWLVYGAIALACLIAFSVAAVWASQGVLSTEITEILSAEVTIDTETEETPETTRTEYIVGECDMLYFSLRRLEFETSIEDNTNGKFHVLTLVDGERIRIRSIDHPERHFDAEFMDMVVVPADMGRYVIENLRTEPICVHKTMLKDGFDAE